MFMFFYALGLGCFVSGLFLLGGFGGRPWRGHKKPSWALDTLLQQQTGLGLQDQDGGRAARQLSGRGTAKAGVSRQAVAQGYQIHTHMG